MNLDPNVTTAIQTWLNTPECDRDLKAGADLMLSLNRNRALYNSILSKPAKFMPKLIYELRKHLRMRLDNMSVADVRRKESAVMSDVGRLVAGVPVLDTSDELPAGHIAAGRRADHDSLPPQVRELWDSNEERFRRIVLLFNELKAMHDMQPCDRYEQLCVLDDLDKRYRENLRLYDGYRAGDAAPSGADPTTGADSARQINNARKTLSKYRSRLLTLDPGDPARPEVLGKIQAAVDMIRACGSGVSAETEERLRQSGIKFD